MLVPLLVLLVGAAVIAIGLMVGFLEVGGPLGLQPADGDGGTDGGAAEVADTSAIDPFGSRGENNAATRNAVDGDDTTVWTTESYDANAPGTTGLRVAAERHRQGRRRPGPRPRDPIDVGGIAITTTDPGWTFELRVGDDLDALGAAEPTGQAFTVEATTGTYPWTRR